MLTATEQRVCRAIESRRDELIRDLRLHVCLPTGGGAGNSTALDESRDRLCDRLIRLGATRENVPGIARPDWLYNPSAVDSRDIAIPPTAICRRLAPDADNSRAVLIAGHLDTVHDPRGTFRDLSISPDARTATGPGCVDMKGGLVIAVAALEALAEIAADHVSWTVLLNSDEETGSFHSEPAIRAEAASGRYAYGLALEPATSDGGLVVERAGTGQFVIHVTGKSAHVGRDFASGVSAVTTLAEAIIAVAKLPDPATGRIINIGPIQGGIATNAVPDSARAWGNVRFQTPDDARAIEAQLRAVVRSLDRGIVSSTQPHPLPDRAQSLPAVSMQTSFNRAAKPLIPATLALAERYRAVSEALGRPLPFTKTAGVCDGNIMQGAGLPTIDTVGVRGGGLHTLDEWIELDSLVNRCQMLAVLLLRLRS